MPGVSVKFKTGPITFKAESAVVGGNVVEAGTGPRSMVPAAAGSTTVLGVALTDAAPYTEPESGVLVALPESGAVACAPSVVPVKTAAEIPAGTLVVAAEGGTVAAAGAAADVATIVGRVIETLDSTTVLVRLGL